MSNLYILCANQTRWWDWHTKN